ncbi:hypothetical protein QFZ31_002481 [Neobacillus niacini]|nr:hypothetical protein [Neobacillus niacini]
MKSRFSQVQKNVIVRKVKAVYILVRKLFINSNPNGE